jgi:RES domain-containing protein
MKLWRAVNHRFAQSAFTGYGARLTGGRWSFKGRSVVYCTSSKSLAMLEIVAFAPLRPAEWSREFVVLRIDVPEEVSRETIRVADLTSGWSSSLDATRTLGEQWLTAGRTCILKVPSTIAPGEANYLINPTHRDFELLFPRPPQSWESSEEYTEYDSVDQTHPIVGEKPIRRELIQAAFGPKDLFLCHAPEDRASVVVPLRDALFHLGVSCWVDFAEIKIGDSIIEKVDEGMRSADYVLVVISPAFLRQPWTTQQLRSALHREAREGKKVVLPMVVNYPNEAVDFSTSMPFAPDKHYYTWKGDADEAAFEITRAVRPRAAEVFTH